MIPLKAYSIENFKSFGPEQRFFLSKINFLFGPNSHGKSSALSAMGIIINALMKREFNISHLNYIDNSPDIFIGNNILNRNSESGHFQLSFEVPYYHHFTDNTFLKLSFTLENLSEGVLKKFSIYEFTENGYDPIIVFDEDYININYDSIFFKRQSAHPDPEVEEFKLSFGKPFDTGRKSYNDIKIDWSNLKTSFSLELDDSEKNISFEEYINREISHDSFAVSEFLNDNINSIFRYLGSLVDKYGSLAWIGPNRTIFSENISIDGRNSFIEDKFLKNKYVFKMNQWLRETGLIQVGYEFLLSQKKLKSGKILKEFGVKRLDESEFCTFDEVGSGIAHIFQILLPFFSDEKTIVIQQPELHLHPSLQVQLVNSIIHLALNNEIQLIIETHSEHFIKAAQLEIARSLNYMNPVLTNGDLSVIYVAKGENGFSKVKKMQLDDTGAFTEPWPDDFFEISGALSLERLRNSVKSKN